MRSKKLLKPKKILSRHRKTSVKHKIIIKKGIKPISRKKETKQKKIKQKGIKSVCPYCGVGCGLLLLTRRGKVVGVQPDKEHPVSRGELCIKGITVDKVVNHPDRLKKPLIRKNGRLVPATWKEALDYVASHMKRIKKTYGPDSIAIMSSAKCTNEENYALQKFARLAIGTNNIDNCARLCHAPSMVGLYESLGRSAMSNSYEDLPQADFILIVGSNPASTQPIGFHRILECKKHGGRIITVDVRKTETATNSDRFVQIKPGTDYIFAAGLMKVILDKGLEDKQFMKHRTDGFKELKESLKKYSLDEIEADTGIPKNDIRDIAVAYARAKKAAIIYGMGMTQKEIGTETILAFSNLMLMTGHVGKPGSGINPLRGCNNVQGECDMGCLPDYLPGYRHLTEENIRKFEKLWHAKLPAEKGLTETEMLEAVPEEIVALYVIGENPMLSHPNQNETRESLENLELLVVQDVFLTETAQLAHVVLPAACFAEKTGTITNTERRVQLLQKAAKPPGEAHEDLWIITQLAKRINPKAAKKLGYKKAEAAFNEIKKVVPQYSGLTYAKLKKRGIQWPCDKKNPNGTQFLYKSDFFGGKKALFYPVAHRSMKHRQVDSDYPFLLISHRTLEHYNTGSFSRRVDSLMKIRSRASVEINRQDAAKLCINDGEQVRLVSETGKFIATARLSDSIQPGVMGIENHFADAAANALTSSATDPLSKTPAFKHCRVRIEKA